MIDNLPNRKKIRVGFRFIDSGAWQGGYNYLLNLCKGLSARGNVQPVVFCGAADSAENRLPFIELLKENFIHSSVFSPDELRQRRLKSLISGCDRQAESVFVNHDIDVVFENADFYGKKFSLPVIAWIPDFQHRHLPQMFSKWNYWRREIGFRAQFKHGRQVMVSSENAKADCQKFYGLPAERTSVVRFAIPWQPPPSEQDCRSAQEKHGLTEPFFLLPNQFWPHKNHQVVVEAVAGLKQSGQPVVIAVTGGATHPDCVPVLAEIQRQVEQEGIANHFRILGKIPWPDLVCLRSSCRALINPSFFEGWSTTIEEAKAAGIPMILSDLGVHREQVKANGLFFDPRQPQRLAQALVATIQQPASDRNDNQLRQLASQRVNDFVDEFCAVASDLAGKK